MIPLRISTHTAFSSSLPYRRISTYPEVHERKKETLFAHCPLLDVFTKSPIEDGLPSSFFVSFFLSAGQAAADAPLSLV